MKTSLGTKDIDKNICISPRSKFISSFDKDLVIFDHSRFFDAICSCRKFANYFTITFITCQPVLTRKIVSFPRNRVRNEDWISFLLNIHHDVCDKPLSRCQPANGLEPSCQIRILYNVSRSCGIFNVKRSVWPGSKLSVLLSRDISSDLFPLKS